MQMTVGEVLDRLNIPYTYQDGMLVVTLPTPDRANQVKGTVWRATDTPPVRVEASTLYYPDTRVNTTHLTIDCWKNTTDRRLSGYVVAVCGLKDAKTIILALDGEDDIVGSTEISYAAYALPPIDRIGTRIAFRDMPEPVRTAVLHKINAIAGKDTP